MADNWKQEHANESERVLDVPQVWGVMEEFASNMGFKFEGLPRYGLMKIVTTAAQVARAQALGIDVETLWLTPEEADRIMLAIAAEAIGEGVPTFVIGEPDA